MENTFLPQDYEAPKSQGGNYMKFQDGENRFRVLSSAIVGYEYWNNENKPVRSKEPFTETPNAKMNQDGRVSIKHFWAFVVWNVKEEKLQVLEVTQAGIQQSITTFVSNEDWGDPKQYDILINREGEGIETRYTVTPCPHKPLDQEIAELYAGTQVNLNALYEGQDPFAEN
jgi:hypothetical protein